MNNNESEHHNARTATYLAKPALDTRLARSQAPCILSELTPTLWIRKLQDREYKPLSQSHPCKWQGTHAQLLQSCPTLCHPVDYSLPGSSVAGMLQARIYWAGLPRPPPGDLPDPGIQPASLMSPALAGRFFTASATWEAHKWQRGDLKPGLSDPTPGLLTTALPCEQERH